MDDRALHSSHLLRFAQTSHDLFSDSPEFVPEWSLSSPKGSSTVQRRSRTKCSSDDLHVRRQCMIGVTGMP